MALPENPITRKETYLAKIAGQEVQIPDVPITREEAYLNQIAKEGTGTKVIANPDDVAEDVLHKVEIDGEIYSVPSGGGGGGSDDYLDLDNKPQVNGVELSGNKTTSDLGITASGVGAIPSTDKGANGGVAELDSNGKVPSSQLPSYVDDVLSYASQSAFPATGETGKIYIAEDTNKTYRWSGSAYAEISASLALGETSSTAYRGDRGKVAYDHSQTTGNPHGTTKGDVGLGNVPNVSTNDQTPTFSEASTRNNIASGEKLSVILGKIAKFFNDLKTVAFSGSYTDLSSHPQINSNTLSGNKTTSDLGINAENVMMSDGVTSVEDKMGNMRMGKLWENPNPSSSFAGQQIALSVVGYDLIFILFKNHTNSDNMLSVVTLNGHGVLMLSATDVLFSRVFDINTKTFTDGFRGGTVDNTVCIPYQIYGIKLT